MKKNIFHSIFCILLRTVQGALIGLGAVLPGISGGVLSVIFGVYRPIMEFLAHPRRTLRTHLFLLLPVFVGAAVGFIGIAGLLSSLLAKYPDESVCLFTGLILGMLPSLCREAGKQGRDKKSEAAAVIAGIAVLALLAFLRTGSAQITPSFSWYLFCGFALALSIIAPGMSFSASLMPLGLYIPFVDGIGHLSPPVIVPGGIGALLTILFLSKFVDRLFKRHYAVTFHAILGIVTAAALMTVPFDVLLSGERAAFGCLFFLAAGIVVACLFDKFNSVFD